MPSANRLWFSTMLEPMEVVLDVLLGVATNETIPEIEEHMPDRDLVCSPVQYVRVNSSGETLEDCVKVSVHVGVANGLAWERRRKYA